MKSEKKKLIKLKAELKVYNKIRDKIEKVLDSNLEIEDLDEYVFSKIRTIEDEIYDIDLEDKEVVLTDGPRFGPGDFVNYEELKYEILEVHHKDKTYKVKFNLSGKVRFIDWTSDLKKWK